MKNSFYNLDYRKTVTSTNDLLKELAKKGAKEGYVLIAEHQTAGRGRMNRNFYSPQNSGIYMSILFRPNIKACEVQLLTTCCAVVVSRAIEKVTNKTAYIKWVNDILVNDKKVSGILTEAAFSTNGNVDFAIVGIGINVWAPKDNFPEDIKNIAGALLDYNDEDIKQKLIDEILTECAKEYPVLAKKQYLKEYKERSILLDKEITYLDNGIQKFATVLDIDKNFGLVVKDDKNNLYTLSTGEVSVRLK